MIGKKSKFEEHAKSKVPHEVEQEERSSNSSGKGSKARGSKEVQSNSDGTRLQHMDGTGHGYKQSSPDDYPEKQEGEEVEEEIPEIEGATVSSRPTRSNNKGSNSSVDQAETKEISDAKNPSTPTIINQVPLKTDTDLLWDEICNGVKGKNSGIPMGFNRLNKYLGLRRSIYTTIGAAAGCGKTSLVDCAYVLNPYDWYIKNKHKSNVQFEVIYFSMERKKTYKLAKWLCMKIWQEENVLMTTDELLSWQNKLDPKKQELANFYIKNYFEEMTQSGVVKIIDGQVNPTGIWKYMEAHAKTRGKIEEVNEWENRYIPNNDNLITNVVHDHAGKTKNEAIGGKYDKKLTIDKASEYYCRARDFLGYSPIMINQFNRTSYQDIQYAKKEGADPDPTVEYWKDSGNVIEDCDVAISLFNPYKYGLEEYMGYNIQDFTDGNGNNKFRGLKIIKNSYGTDNIRIGLGFLGEVSLFKELTRAADITQKELNFVINNDFFLNL